MQSAHEALKELFKAGKLEVRDGEVRDIFDIITLVLFFFISLF